LFNSHIYTTRPFNSCVLCTQPIIYPAIVESKSSSRQTTDYLILFMKPLAPIVMVPIYIHEQSLCSMNSHYVTLRQPIIKSIQSLNSISNMTKLYNRSTIGDNLNLKLKNII